MILVAASNTLVVLLIGRAVGYCKYALVVEHRNIRGMRNIRL